MFLDAEELFLQGKCALLESPMRVAIMEDKCDAEMLASPSMKDTLRRFEDDSSLNQASSGSEFTVSRLYPTHSNDDSLDDSTFDLNDDASFRRGRKNAKKNVWDAKMVLKFTKAVESLPYDEQLPARIAERMGAAARSLTRAQIAAQLKKYRSSTTSKRQQQASGVEPIPFSLEHPQYNDHQSMMMQAAQHQFYAQPAPVISPTSVNSMGVVLGTPCFPQPAPGVRPPALLPSLASSTAAAGVFPDLREALSQKQPAMPLGLKLDCAAIAQQLNKM